LTQNNGNEVAVCALDSGEAKKPWILFGDLTDTGSTFSAADESGSPTRSGKVRGSSVQVGTFSAGSIGSPGYSLDIQELTGLSGSDAAKFDLMIQYGGDSVYQFSLNGFAKTKGKFINNDYTASGVVIGEHGMYGDRTPIDSYYATYCAYNGGCGGSGRDFWQFSTHGVYPSGASKIPCGFYYPANWKNCPSGDNTKRMRYYIRFHEPLA